MGSALRIGQCQSYSCVDKSEMSLRRGNHELSQTDDRTYWCVTCKSQIVEEDGNVSDSLDQYVVSQELAMDDIRTMDKRGGFSLIELMIMIAILAILMAIAIPIYQDYSIRTKASECVNIAASAKVAVSETYQASGGAWPSDWVAAGYAATPSEYCAPPTYIASGAFLITTDSIGADNITFTFSPNLTDEGSRIDWICSAENFDTPLHVAPECRPSTP